MSVKYKVVAICNIQDKCPIKDLMDVLKYLPLKNLVLCRELNPYFKFHIDNIEIQNVKLGDLISFMNIRQIADIPIPESLNLSRTISQNKASLQTLYDNYKYLKSFMAGRDITNWIKKTEGTGLLGLSDGSSYVSLNTNVPSIYGVLINSNTKYFGAIKVKDNEGDLVLAEGKIEKKVVRRPDGHVWEWIGCEIEANGDLVAGKIEKNIVRLPNVFVLEWIGCEIEANGKLVAGKIEKHIVRLPNGFVEELVGCEIEANGKLVAGKIEKKVIRLPDGCVWESHGCNLDSNGELVAGKIEKKVKRQLDGIVLEWFGCEIAAGGELVAGKIEKRVIRMPDGGVAEWVGCKVEANGMLVFGKIEKVVRLANGVVVEWVGCKVEADGKLVAEKNREESRALS